MNLLESLILNYGEGWVVVRCQFFEHRWGLQVTLMFLKVVHNLFELNFFVNLVRLLRISRTVHGTSSTCNNENF